MELYEEFLNKKTQLSGYYGFDPIFIPEFLFDFQQVLVEWALKKGRAAVFADCGLGKTPMQLVWAENIVRHTNKPVLILTPLAVSAQTKKEGEKFNIECSRSSDGKPTSQITITNYEKLHLFDWKDYSGCVCDESGILKNFDGKRKSQITEFMKKLKYRLLCTATASPNDFIELGTSSEALGELGYTDMLTRFFKNDQNTIKPTTYFHRGLNFELLREQSKWRFKSHAELPFWKWVSSWARALRRPSDFGFDDNGFILPPKIETEHLVTANKLADGMLFAFPAIGLKEQREERKRTIQERCEKVADLVSKNGNASLVWCHLNSEGDLLEKLIPDGIQISGKDPDEKKESKFMDFVNGKTRVLITKPKIGAWGLNFQHCSHITFFPSHSFEQYYQGIRRCWRFGQKNTVQVDIITTEGEREVMKNLRRKSLACDKMFSQIVKYMADFITINRSTEFNEEEKIPSWL